MSLTNEKNKLLIIVIIFLGITPRFAITQLGHNFHFESYCIVGKLVNEGKSIYANTTRYNYGFIFFVIQGFLYRFLHRNGLNFYEYIIECADNSIIIPIVKCINNYGYQIAVVTLLIILLFQIKNDIDTKN